MNADTWKQKVLTHAPWLRLNPNALYTIVDRLATAPLGATCIWHELARWRGEHDDRPRCRICGAKCSRLSTDGVHELCRARQDRNLSTPPIAERNRCGCAKCGEFFCDETA